MPDFSYEGEFPDRELGDAFRSARPASSNAGSELPGQPRETRNSADENAVPLNAVEKARSYFVRSGVVVSQTVDAQRWRVPDTESFIPAVEARELSLRVRSELGGRAV